jgi:hypothetical protein
MPMPQAGRELKKRKEMEAGRLGLLPVQIWLILIRADQCYPWLKVFRCFGGGTWIKDGNDDFH